MYRKVQVSDTSSSSSDDMTPMSSVEHPSRSNTRSQTPPSDDDGTRIADERPELDNRAGPQGAAGHLPGPAAQDLQTGVHDLESQGGDRHQEDGRGGCQSVSDNIVDDNDNEEEEDEDNMEIRDNGAAVAAPTVEDLQNVVESGSPDDCPENRSEDSLEHVGMIYSNPLYEASEASENDEETSTNVTIDPGNEPEVEGVDFEDNLNSTFNTSASSCDSVTCYECGVHSDNYNGQWLQSTEHPGVYLCEKCHHTGLKRQEAVEVDTRQNSNSSDTIPLSDPDVGDVESSTASPEPVQKKPRGRRPTNAQLQVTPALTRSRSNRLGMRPIGGL